MTAGRLMGYAAGLANSHWVRYWLHWNYPHAEPWEMAISLRKADGSDVGNWAPESIMSAFRPHVIVDRTYWVIERTDDEGRPYCGPVAGDI